MAEYKVKWFASEMQGAPSLGDTTAGTLTALLKAVLVTGFGTLTINALSFDAAKGWAVATFSGGHAYLQDSVIQVDGVSPAAYNGEHRVMQVTATQVWFELDGGDPGAPGNGAAMTMKVAPLGWTITHESGNGQIFIVRPTNVSESGNVSLRIDNSTFSGWSGTYGAVLAKVAMVEDVVDINSYTTIYEHRWPAAKRYSNGRWDLIGDSQLFYFLPAFAAANVQFAYSFGYIRSIRPGDRYHAVMNWYPTTDVNDSNRRWSSGVSASYSSYGNQYPLFDNADEVLARPYSQLFGAVSWVMKGLFGRIGSGLPVPNPVDNGFYVSTDPIMVIESSGAFRGYLPGIVVPYGTVSGWDRKNFANMPAIPNKLIRFINVGFSLSQAAGTPQVTMMGFDLTGPWR